jgi:hypothetical protein
MRAVGAFWWRVPVVLRAALVFLACFVVSITIGYPNNSIGLLSAVLIAVLLAAWIWSEYRHAVRQNA